MPTYLDGVYHEAAFHGLQPHVIYGSDNEPRQCTVAVVELKDGRMKNVDPTKVTFLDEHEDEREPERQGEVMTSGELLTKVERLKSILVGRARGIEPTDPDEYTSLRRELIALPPIKSKLPSFVNSCRTVPEFWLFIQPKFKTYKERTDFLQQEFETILSTLESGAPSGQPVADLFRHQFPLGLPFGLNKPHVVVKPQSGSQVTMFEDESEVGIIRGGVYPSFTFSALQAALKGTPIANSKLNEKLITLSQTLREKQFFEHCVNAYQMFASEVPVLIPQAWIQWHSKKKDDLRAIGSPYVADLYRVDFVAFWNNRRFAILIDDIGHYGRQVGGRWDADEAQYAGRLKEDRKLRKEGWDVFRVSNWEIRNPATLPEILTDLREFMQF